MERQTIRLNGVTLLLDPRGAVFWPGQELLIVSDLHLEKGAALWRRDGFLPPYDSRDTLARIGKLITAYQPKTVISLGDSLHNEQVAAAMPDELHDQLAALQKDLDWIWIAGNHDPALPTRFGGLSLPEVTLGALVFRHQALPGQAAGEISGHYHPKARLTLRGKRQARACFLSDGQRLILPALGSYTGGLWVDDPAITDLFPKGFDAYLLGRNALFRFPKAALVA